MGIAAIINTNQAPLDESVLRAMMGSSPQSQIAVDGCVGLGRVLRGWKHEPEVSRHRDGQVCAVMEGRLDDREALISALGDRDAGPASDPSDALLIIRAYETWNEECVSRLLGDFAFCLWDGRRGRLFCARDHFGVKPLYYAHVGGALIVSSVLRWVRRHPAISSRLRDETIGDFLLFGICAEPSQTSFAGVSRVPPAHRLSYSLSSDAVRVNRYWTLETGELIRYANPGEYVEHFSHLLRVAVADRVRGGPIGVLMSGGLDSSSVTATAAAVFGAAARDRLHAFTFAYDTLMEDKERPFSSAIATALGIGLTSMPADRYEPFARWDGDSQPPEPTLEALTAAMTDMLRLASGHGGAVLTGDGGDSSLLPSTLIDQAGVVPFPSLAADIWRAWRARRVPPFGIRGWIARRFDREAGVPEWLADDLLSVFDARARLQEVRARETLAGTPRSRAVNDLFDPWWTAMFEGLDPGATRCAVELRYPFFDVRLASFTLRLPSFPWCLNKHALRSAMRGRLPEAVRTRPKTPLGTSPVAPADEWSSARALALFESTPEVSRYVDIRKFRSLVRGNSLLSGETPAAWAAISLAMWLRCEPGKGLVSPMPARVGTA
jgi:asparagine synthase (glutamine-hydrolysing)